MRVLHITTNVFKQSACYRLHKALLENEVDSKILVVEKFHDLEKVIPYVDSFSNKVKWKIRKKLDDREKSKFHMQTVFSLGHRGVKIENHPLVKEADVIHLHWINDSFMDIKSIKNISNMGKPIVWTCHDSWPFTGGCHVRYGCDKFTNSCEDCPLVNKKGKVYAKKLLKDKYEIFKDIPMKLIGPGQWTVDCIKESKVFKGKEAFKISNTLDLNTFSPMNKDEAKKKLNLPEGKIILTFGAVNGTKVKYKGYEYLLEALKSLLEENPLLKDKIHCVVFGSDYDENIDKLNITSTFTGYISEEKELALIYNGTDLFLVPSIEDSLNSTVMESLSSETPVVAFKTGGIPELIRHKENGYLAEFKNSEDFKEGIKYCLNNNKDNVLGKQGRKHVEENFNMKVIAEKHIQTYKNKGF